MSGDTPLLTVAVIADRCDTTPRTVRSWIAKGHLPAMMLGGQFRIRAEDFEAFLDEREVTKGK